MLPACLKSLREQNFEGTYEIIVVDNNSTDLTLRIARLYGAKVVKETRQGIVFARQAGFGVAGGKIICSTDADTIVPHDWLTKIYAQFERDSQIVAVGGRYDLVGVNSLSKLVWRVCLPFLFMVDWLVSGGGSLAGSNLAVRRAAFMQAGRFNTGLVGGEDIDLGKRLKKIGQIKVLFSLQVRTSARRMEWGWKNLLFYGINAMAVLVRNRSILTTFKNIRQKSYEAFDSFNDAVFVALAGISCVITILTVGAIPGFNLWSVSGIKTSDQVIALTFDDGPNAPYTRQILAVLEEKHVPATFFVVGENARRYPELIRLEYERGHLIANHSWSHNQLEMFKNPSQILGDASQVDDQVQSIIGKRPRLFRPPKGYRSVWGAKVLSNYGYQIVTWNDIVSDWSPKTSSKQVAINIIRRAKPGGIIDLHDGGENRDNVDRSNTVKAVGEIIDLLQAEGYRFVRLDELLHQPGYFTSAD